MAEIATIARPYADALFGASSADLQGTAAWLDELAAVAADPQLQRFVDNPKIASDQVFELIAGVVRTPLPTAAQNFLRLLIENGRLAALPEIAAQYRVLQNSHAGSSDAVVYSAFPIEGEALGRVTAALEKRFGRKLGVTVETDPELIGGIRVVVGDEVLDTSVKARLAQMKAALAA